MTNKCAFTGACSLAPSTCTLAPLRRDRKLNQSIEIIEYSETFLVLKYSPSSPLLSNFNSPLTHNLHYLINKYGKAFFSLANTIINKLGGYLELLPIILDHITK